MTAALAAVRRAKRVLPSTQSDQMVPISRDEELERLDRIDSDLYEAQCRFAANITKEEAVGIALEQVAS